MEQTLNDFKNSIMPNRTGKGKRNIKITNSWGVYDAYKTIRKNGWFNIGKPVSEKDFYAIIRGVNNLLANEIVLGHKVALPEQMGKFELMKYEKGVSIVNGKLKNTYPIDWDKTIRLWFEDKEAYDERILVRNEQPFVYHVTYRKEDATYENKTFYQFQLHQRLRKILSHNIKKGITDTLWYRK